MNGHERFWCLYLESLGRRADWLRKAIWPEPPKPLPIYACAPVYVGGVLDVGSKHIGVALLDVYERGTAVLISATTLEDPIEAWHWGFAQDEPPIDLVVIETPGSNVGPK